CKILCNIRYSGIDKPLLFVSAEEALSFQGIGVLCDFCSEVCCGLFHCLPGSSSSPNLGKSASRPRWLGRVYLFKKSCRKRCFQVRGVKSQRGPKLIRWNQVAAARGERINTHPDAFLAESGEALRGAGDHNACWIFAASGKRIAGNLDA